MALAKRPMERFASTADFYAALEKGFRDGGVNAAPTPLIPVPEPEPTTVRRVSETKPAADSGPVRAREFDTTAPDKQKNTTPMRAAAEDDDDGFGATSLRPDSSAVPVAPSPERTRAPRAAQTTPPGAKTDPAGPSDTAIVSAPRRAPKPAPQKEPERSTAPERPSAKGDAKPPEPAPPRKFPMAALVGIVALVGVGSAFAIYKVVGGSGGEMKPVAEEQLPVLIAPVQPNAVNDGEAKDLAKADEQKPLEPPVAVTEKKTPPVQKVKKTAPVEVATPPEVAQLRVTSSSAGKLTWGTVTIDGVARGNTPLSVDLPAGKHVISVTRPGFKEVVKTVVLKPGAPKFARSTTKTFNDSRCTLRVATRSLLRELAPGCGCS